MAARARMISAGLLPPIMRKRATVEPVMARFSDASSVNPRRPTAACSRSTVALLAICRQGARHLAQERAARANIERRGGSQKTVELWVRELDRADMVGPQSCAVLMGLLDPRRCGC